MSPHHVVDALCPLRPGEYCSLCVPGANGPANCPTLAEVMRDPELREGLAQRRREWQDDQQRDEARSAAV